MILVFFPSLTFHQLHKTSGSTWFVSKSVWQPDIPFQMCPLPAVCWWHQHISTVARPQWVRNCHLLDSTTGPERECEGEQGPAVSRWTSSLPYDFQKWTEEIRKALMLKSFTGCTLGSSDPALPQVSPSQRHQPSAHGPQGKGAVPGPCPTAGSSGCFKINRRADGEADYCSS